MIKLAVWDQRRCDVAAMGLLITLCASAGAATAATLHQARPRGHSRSAQSVTVDPDQHLATPTGFAVPGWSDAQTQQWLDNATAGPDLY
jgi:hypothetical protein